MFGGPRAPVAAAEDRPLDLERIHEGDDVEGERRLLAVAERRPPERKRVGP